MIKIGLISDTHSYLDPAILKHFENCDEIWHLGDIGDESVLHSLQKAKPVRAVYGNIDTPQLRYELPEYMVFEVEQLKVLLIHIGSLPGKHSSSIKKIIKIHAPDLLICGHSHILRVIKDEHLVYINPGAAGHHGFHAVRTIMRLEIHERKITNIEVIELGKR